MADDRSFVRVEEMKEKRKILKRTEEKLQDMEFRGVYELEADSVYGSVIAIPQIARSLGCTPTMLALCWRSWMLLILNYFLQGSAMMFIAEESQVMDVLSGKMHLCDFAYDLEECPDHNHCTGPGGTKYTADGLYSYDIWSVRIYMRDTLKAAVSGTPLDSPELKKKVDKAFAPGEYGMENYWCRVLACFIFMMAEVRDLFKTCELIAVLWYTPHHGESWVYKDETTNGEGDPLSKLKFRVAGSPIGWKILNFIILVIPKVFLLYNVCWMGLRFLMETAGIIDLVLGAMTMDFILTLDEIIFSALGSATTKHIMGELEGFMLETGDPDDIVVDTNTSNKTKWGAIKLTLPRRLIFTLIVLFVFEVRYYVKNCTRVDGMWVSQPLFLPATTKFNFMSFLTGEVPHAEQIWEMPPMDDL